MATTLTKNYQIVSRHSTNLGEIRVYARYSSQSIENNITYYNLKVVYYANLNINFSNANLNVSCGSKNWDYNFGYTSLSPGENTMLEVGWYFNHKTDGTLDDQKLTTNWTASYGGNTGAFSAYVNVPRINRYPMITNAPNFNDEENPTITYSTISGFSDGTYDICITDSSYNIVVPYRDIVLENGSYTFELTTSEREALRSLIPNNNSTDIHFTIRTTTTSNTYYSTVTRTFSITNADPTFTHSEIETNQKVIDLLGSSASSIIQNVSIMRATITPTALKGASISSVKISSGEYTETKTSSPYTFDIPVTVASYVVNVTDSRGNSSSTAVQKTLIPYTPVKLNIFTFERENPTSSNIIVNVEGTYLQTTFGSTANVPTIKWKLDNGSYATIPSSAYSIDTTNNKITITNYVLSNTLVYTSQGYFSIELSDLLTSSEETNILVLKGIPTFDYGEHDLKVNGDLFVADINGENAVNVLDAISNMLAWQHLGTTSGSSSINLPSSFKELLCIVKLNNNDNLNISIPIPYEYLTTTAQGFNGGYLQVYNGNAAMCRISATTTTASLSTAYIQGSSVLNNSSVTYYYR